MTIVSDLKVTTAKLARRIQNLDSGRTYVIILVKLSADSWILTIEPKGKAEIISG